MSVRCKINKKLNPSNLVSGMEEGSINSNSTVICHFNMYTQHIKHHHVKHRNIFIALHSSSVSHSLSFTKFLNASFYRCWNIHIYRAFFCIMLQDCTYEKKGMHERLKYAQLEILLSHVSQKRVGSFARSRIEMKFIWERIFRC